MPNILKQKNYEGVVGVACGPEVMMSGEKLSSMGMAWQSVPVAKERLCLPQFLIRKPSQKLIEVIMKKMWRKAYNGFVRTVS